MAQGHTALSSQAAIQKSDPRSWLFPLTHEKWVLLAGSQSLTSRTGAQCWVGGVESNDGIQLHLCLSVAFHMVDLVLLRPCVSIQEKGQPSCAFFMLL